MTRTKDERKVRDLKEQSPRSLDPKYPRPKILLVDLPESAENELRAKGYNVLAGTFGLPTSVEAGTGYEFVDIRASLPNLPEREFVAIDLKRPEPEETEWKSPAPGQIAIWQKATEGEIDPGPLAASYASGDLDRIHKHGGIIVLFVDPMNSAQYAEGVSTNRRLNINRKLTESRWSCLSYLNDIQVDYDSGEELRNVAGFAGLSSQAESTNFTAKIDRKYTLASDRWHVLAQNKYGDAVAALISPRPESEEGWIILLPRVPGKGKILIDLLETFVPAASPTMFEDLSGQSWRDRFEYQLPEVREINREIDRLRDETQKNISDLEVEINEVQANWKFIEDLLTETGERLEGAVMEAIQFLGFTDVTASDATDEPEGESGSAVKDSRRREDLQIRDRSPLLLVEVKGISGLPKESSSLQVTKYLAPRMRQLDRLDVAGLAVVNHQRGIDPLNRESDAVFQDDVVLNAIEQGFGLLTTVDLARIVRGFKANDWSHGDVAELFYKAGRIEPIPCHYVLAGEVTQVWKEASAFSVVLRESLKVGARIGYRSGLDTFESTITSLRINDQPVEVAPAEIEAGICLDSGIERVARGRAVYIVN